MVREHCHPTHSATLLATAAALVGTTWAAAILARRAGVRRAQVRGDSMLPSLADGDRLLLGPLRRARPGQVVAVRDPRRADRLLVKRVRTVGEDGIDVRGDNPSASTDSRHFGLLPTGAIVGRVWYRYAPRERAGWHPGETWPAPSGSGPA